MSVVCRESVSHASGTVCLFCGAECVVVSMCGGACVIVYVWFLIIIICPRCSPFCNVKTYSHRWRIVFGGLSALRMAQGPPRRSLAVSGARLCGWLACGGFQTLLALMILSAGQQKGHRIAGVGCHSVGVAAAGWLESGSECRCVRRAEIEEAPDDGKRRPLALPMFRQ